MKVFELTLTQMLMMFTLILAGFILGKSRLVPENTGTVMAKLENYIFVPALSISNQIAQCTVQNFKESSPLILCGFLITLAAIGLSYPLSKALVGKKFDSYIQNIYKYALTFGNYGYMGNFIVLGVWGEEVFYQYLMLTFGIYILGYSWGLYMLIPKEQNAGVLKNLKKGLLNPPMVGLVLGMVLGLINAGSYLPEFVLSAISNAGKCQGPIAMLLVGIVIGEFDIKKMFCDKNVYIATFLRLVAIPSLIMIVLNLVGATKELMLLVLIAFATPLGLNTVVFPAVYGSNTRIGASMAMISHTLSVITIPLMYLIFIGG